jgi:hypothetical protein
MMGHGAPPLSALNPRRSALVVLVLVAQLLGAGLGSALIRALNAKTRPHKLGVDQSNELPAAGLFSRNGCGLRCRSPWAPSQRIFELQ